MQRETSYGVDAPRHDAVHAVRLVVATATVASLHLFAPAAAAQEPWPALVVRGGALIADLSSDVRVDATVGSIGTSIGSFVTALNGALGSNGSASFSAGKLSIAAKTKDPGGLGVADLASIGEPGVILDKLEITATAE